MRDASAVPGSNIPTKLSPNPTPVSVTRATATRAAVQFAPLGLAACHGGMGEGEVPELAGLEQAFGDHAVHEGAHGAAGPEVSGVKTLADETRLRLASERCPF